MNPCASAASGRREVRNLLVFDAGGVAQLLDGFVELTLRDLDFLTRSFLVQKTFTHRKRDLVEVANLGQDVVGFTAQADESPLLGERATIAQPELVRRQPPGLLQYRITAPSRNRRMRYFTLGVSLFVDGTWFGTCAVGFR